jgi:hypothetical protein
LVRDRDPGCEIRDPEKNHPRTRIRIPDPWGKNAPDPGSRSATLDFSDSVLWRGGGVTKKFIGFIRKPPKAPDKRDNTKIPPSLSRVIQKNIVYFWVLKIFTFFSSRIEN